MSKEDEMSKQDQAVTPTVRDTITYQDFEKLDVRVGRIVRAQPHPTARNPAIQVWIDFGPDLGERKSSAKLTKLYHSENLVGRQIIAVVNFPRLQIADFMSEVLVLGVMEDAETVVLLQPDREVPLGTRMA